MSSVNFELIEKLRDHLVFLRANERSRKFNMSTWLSYLPSDRDLSAVSVSTDRIGQLRYEAKLLLGLDDIVVSPVECGTVACLAGHVALLTDVPERVPVDDWAKSQLGLDGAEAHHMFGGSWSENDQYEITIDEAIQYLDLVLVTRNVMVSIDDGDSDDEEELY